MLKKLHELYDYYYYRISKFYKETSEFYKDSGSDLYCYDANLLIYSAINLIILTLISIVLMLSRRYLEFEMDVCCLCSSSVFWPIFNEQKNIRNLKINIKMTRTQH